jgi:hypothetical protein
MRLALLPLLLSGAAWADEPRAWRAVFTVASRARPPADGRGGETQTERAEFVLVTRPARSKGLAVPFTFQKGTGSYGLRIDRSEGAVTTRGDGSGKLFVKATGTLKDGRYRIVVRVQPERLVTLVTMSGMDRRRFRTFRTSVTRATFLGAFVIEGDLKGRVIEGRREFEDRKAKFTRDVVIEWRVERVDPVLRGIVVDHLGRPVEGMSLRASSTTPARIAKALPPLVRLGRSGEGGRFSLQAFWATWGLALAPLEKNGVLYLPREVAPWSIRFDDAPERELVVDAYRWADLPDAHLFEKRFRRDPGMYAAHLRRRADPTLLRRALVAPPGK